MKDQRVATEMAQDLEGRHTKPRPAPRSFGPQPKEHKDLDEAAALATNAWRYLKEPGGNADPLLPVRLGGFLLEMKKSLKRGYFQLWIETYCGFTTRTARRFMAKHRHYEATKDLPPVEEPDPEPTPEEIRIDKEMKELLLPGVKW